MQLSECNAKVNYISELQDSPSLTTAELKAAFDAGGESIKTYLEATLLPELEAGIPDVVNDLTTGGTTAALSAEQGKTLNTNKQDKVANVSDTEISYLNGVTSAIQTQLNAKQKTISYGTSAPSGGVSGDIFLRYS